MIFGNERCQSWLIYITFDLFRVGTAIGVKTLFINIICIDFMTRLRGYCGMWQANETSPNHNNFHTRHLLMLFELRITNKLLVRERYFL